MTPAMTTFGIWVGAILTLFVYSFLYKDNPLFRIAEHLYIGSAAGYYFVLQIDNQLRPTVMTRIIEQGMYIRILPILLGLLIYTRFFRSISWLARYTISFQVGVAAGIIITRDFRSLFINQLIATMNPVSGSAAGLENLLVMVCVAATFMYFFFTIEHKGAVGLTAKFGRLTMMVALGAAFGNTVMARVSLFLGRLQFLLGDWLNML